MKNLDGSPNLIHDLDNSTDSQNGISYPKFFSLLAVVIIIGALAGFIVTKFKKTSSSSGKSNKTLEKTAGIVDKKTFKDSAEGIMKDGGIEGEGNFHLERPGGVSQNVYLTSSTVDLSDYIGRKVRVWGATFEGEKAGWLMDVGLVELL